MNILSQFKEKLKNEKSHFWIFLALLVCLTVFTMFRYSMFTLVSVGHDAAFHYNRFLILMEALKNGTFPTYIDSQAIDNYGYASNLFYPNFTFIPFALIGNLIGVFRAYQLMYFVFTLLTGLLTYLSVYKVFKNKYTAYISAILYTFCLYRLQDYFERAAIAEAITFTFLPIVFWGLYEVIKGDCRKWYILTIGYSLFILTHLLSTLLLSIIVTVTLLIFVKYFIKEPKRILYLILAGCFTVLCSAIFLFPFFEQIISDSFNYETFSNYPFVRIAAKELPKALLSYSFLPSIGITLILPLIARFFISGKDKIIRSIDLFAIAAFLIIIYTSDLLPLFLYPNYIFGRTQFIWRLFEFSSFLLALSCGYYVANFLKGNTKSFFFLSGIIFLLFASIYINSMPYKHAKWGITNLPERGTSNNFFLGFADNIEYLPIPATVNNLVERGNAISKKHADTEIYNIKRSRSEIVFEINTIHNEIIELPLTYYKGYYAYNNKEKIDIRKSKNGLIEIPINTSGSVQVKFEGTFIQKNSLYITLIAFLTLTIYAFRRKMFNKIKS